MDDNDISDIWTIDSNISRVNESFIIAKMSEYIWYVNVIHIVFYILKLD